jgi:hypothetical protein
MKVGDIVKYKVPDFAKHQAGAGKDRPIGIIVKLFKKKCWRTQELGPKINWDLVEPEQHAEVIINDNTQSFPITELELV